MQFSETYLGGGIYALVCLNICPCQFARRNSCTNVLGFTLYPCICLYIYIYIYSEREREREKHTHTHTHTRMFVTAARLTAIISRRLPKCVNPRKVAIYSAPKSSANGPRGVCLSKTLSHQSMSPDILYWLNNWRNYINFVYYYYYYL